MLSKYLGPGDEENASPLGCRSADALTWLNATDSCEPFRDTLNDGLRGSEESWMVGLSGYPNESTPRAAARDSLRDILIVIGSYISEEGLDQELAREDAGGIRRRGTWNHESYS
jgi:hypothetical protein